MCYSDFRDWWTKVAELDADVISIESSRSQGDLLDGFSTTTYTNELGPGVYDIHSPRIPPAGEIAGFIRNALRAIPVEKLWINPDCGLKTRHWQEVKPAIQSMVAAAKVLRAEQAKGAALDKFIGTVVDNA